MADDEIKVATSEEKKSRKKSARSSDPNIKKSRSRREKKLKEVGSSDEEVKGGEKRKRKIDKSRKTKKKDEIEEGSNTEQKKEKREKKETVGVNEAEPKEDAEQAKKTTPTTDSPPEEKQVNKETDQKQKIDEEKKRQMHHPKATQNMRPIMPEPEKKKGFFGKLVGKKKKEQVGQMGIIAGSVKHEGHAGFSEGGALNTMGLPPNIAEIFKKLDSILRGLGKEGVTQAEMAYVLKDFGHLLFPEPPPEPTPAPVPDPIPGDYDSLLAQYNIEKQVLNGLKMTHTEIQQSKAKLKQEVEELNTLLSKERNELKEQMERNTKLEVEIAKLKSSKSTNVEQDKKDDGDDDDDDAFSNLEKLMKEKLDDASNKLFEEQKRTKLLQDQLNQAADEKAALLARLGESEEILKQSRDELARSYSNNTSSGNVSISNSQKMETSTPPPAPAPPPPGPPPPMAPPLTGSMGGVKPSGGGGGLDFSNVALKKTEQVEKPANTTADLLKEIRGGAALKKVVSIFYFCFFFM